MASTIESATDELSKAERCTCMWLVSYPGHVKGRKSGLSMRPNAALSPQGDLHLLRSSKMSGRRKLSNDHSSARLFCSGVPVSSSLLAASYDFRALESNRNMNISFT